MVTEGHEVSRTEQLQGRDRPLEQLLDDYMVIEDAYVAATAAHGVEVEGTNTSLFPPATSMTCASAR